MQPQRIVGIMLFALGIVLLIMSINAMDSFSSQVSSFFTGAPTDRAIWLLIGGVAAMILGSALTVRASRVVDRSN